MQSKQKQLVLGSTSPFRKELLQRLNKPFTTDSPNIDESVKERETPERYVHRLAIEKAQTVAQKHLNSLIIGSDQCSILDGVIRGKPHTHENATKQLSESSGKCVSFLTGLCLFDSSDNTYQSEVVSFDVNFRELTLAEIENYLLTEKPYQCAGSFKSEGLGISLFKNMQGDDPTSLIGLPLISLTKMLRNVGIPVP